MKLLNKILIAIAIVIGIMAPHWIFNHVNAWLGIICYVIVISIGVDYLIKILKNKI